MPDYWDYFDDYAASIERYYGNIRGKNGKRMTPEQVVAWHEQQRDQMNAIYCAGCGRELTEKAARVESDGTVICVDCTH